MTKFTLDQEYWITQFEKTAATYFSKNNNLRVELFFNPCNHNSMRLTKNGHHFFKNLKIVDYPVHIKSAIMPADLLLLERYLVCPYYIQNLRKLILFDESTATMLYLHHGDLQTYLHNLKNHS